MRALASSRLGFSALLLLGACAAAQYVALPGATSVPYESWQDLVFSGDVGPTVTVLEGDPAMAVGSTVRLSVDLTPVTDLAATHLVVLTPTLYGYWDVPLTDEEIAAKLVDLEVRALDAEPDAEECGAADDAGPGACSQEADNGMDTLFVSAADDAAIGAWGMAPLQLPPATPDTGGTAGTCDRFTYDDCCGGSSGIQAVECYVDPACACPSPATQSGVNGEGLLICACPGA
jgi:hypothetical protein